MRAPLISAEGDAVAHLQSVAGFSVERCDGADGGDRTRTGKPEGF